MVTPPECDTEVVFLTFNVANFLTVSVPLPFFRITKSKTTNTKSQTKTKTPLPCHSTRQRKRKQRLTWKRKNVNRTTQHIGDRYHSFDVTRSRQKNKTITGGQEGKGGCRGRRIFQVKTRQKAPQATAVLRVAVWRCPQLVTGTLHHCRSFKGKLLSSVTPKGCFVPRHSGCRYLSR